MSSSLSDAEIKDKIERSIQIAVNKTGFGRFNWKVMLLSYLICLNTALSISGVGFILPLAECDFQMNTLDKSRISSMQIFGMICGSYFWGCFASLKGRKIALLTSLLFYGVLEILSSLIPEYWTFLFLKFLSGFAISGQTAVVFVYLNEFQPCKYSELLMSCMEAAWSIGLIILPFVAWIIIPLEISYRLGIFFFRSWNLFILICSLPSLLLGVCMYFSYETPKFLAQTGQTEQLLELLGTMYSQNTGNPSDQYFKEIAKSDNSAREMLNLSKNGNYENDQQNKEVASISVNKMITDILTQTTLLFKNPYLTRTLKLVILAYFITSSYYALMYWFPELFQRFLTFEIHNMNETANICIISEYWRDFKNTKNETLISMKNVIDCQRSIHNDLFYHTLYLGLGCLPLSIILPLTIKYVGYKSYLSTRVMLNHELTKIRTKFKNFIRNYVFYLRYVLDAFRRSNYRIFFQKYEHGKRCALVLLRGVLVSMSERHLLHNRRHLSYELKSDSNVTGSDSWTIRSIGGKLSVRLSHRRLLRSLVHYDGSRIFRVLCSCYIPSTENESLRRRLPLAHRSPRRSYVIAYCLSCSTTVVIGNHSASNVHKYKS